MLGDTIFALSSAKTTSAIAVFRISGPDSLFVINHMLPKKINIKPRYVHRSILVNKASLEEIDDVMFVYFKSPNSFTGEDVVEIYTHGSIAVVNSLTEAILQHPNVRYAEAGEFTKRAVINSKMDLVSAESLIDLINSETSMQKKQALKQMKGGFYKECEYWRKDLIKIMSLIEAYIDFPDEDIPGEVLEDAENKINNILNSFEKYLNDNNKGERLRNGIKLAIFGKPNVGKSSLINLLTKRNVAIVSPISGTTRDIIETHIDIAGYPFTLLDTAGITEDTSDEIEAEGIRRARLAVEEADLKIHLFSAEDNAFSPANDANTIYVVNKIDVIEPSIDGEYVKISIKENIGINNLINEIAERAKILAGSGEDVVLTNQRQKNALKRAKDALERVNFESDLVLVAEDLRIASRDLSFLIGRVDIEEVLDEVFASFCIGK